VQKKAGCIIGKDYPEPMLDEKAAKEDTLARVKASYDLKIMGDDPSALDGSAREKLVRGSSVRVADCAARGSQRQDRRRRRARSGRHGRVYVSTRVDAS